MWSFSDEKTEDQDETDAQSKSSDVVGADEKDTEIEKTEDKEPETEQPDDVKQSGQGKKSQWNFRTSFKFFQIYLHSRVQNCWHLYYVQLWLNCWKHFCTKYLITTLAYK